MCVICIKKRGVRFPKREQVIAMCKNNHDGFSLVYSDGNGKPKICKTLSEDKFIELYDRLLKRLDYRTCSMFIHARIKTHGTMRIGNCHGWKQNGLIFAHNGVLRIANRGDMTDSETYFRDIFSPAYHTGGWKMAERTIEAIIDHSKFVFMDNDGNIRHYGQYIEDDGLLFSNSSYRSYRSHWSNDRFYRCTRNEWNQALKDDFLF